MLGDGWAARRSGCSRPRRPRPRRGPCRRSGCRRSVRTCRRARCFGVRCSCLSRLRLAGAHDLRDQSRGTCRSSRCSASRDGEGALHVLQDDLTDQRRDGDPARVPGAGHRARDRRAVHGAPVHVGAARRASRCRWRDARSWSARSARRDLWSRPQGIAWGLLSAVFFAAYSLMGR